jgi:hypothetical protein
MYLTSILDPDAEEVSFVRGGDIEEEEGRRILKMSVPYLWYAVMTAHPGGYGEKREEYRVDTPGKTYWRSRLAGREYDIVKMYAGTRYCDERAPWTMFRCEHIHDLTPKNGIFELGPYSNGQIATFRTDFLWGIGLGVVMKRHYCGRGHIDFSHIPQKPAPTLPFSGGRKKTPSTGKQTFSNSGNCVDRSPGEVGAGANSNAVPDFASMMTQLQKGIAETAPDTSQLVKKVVDALGSTFQAAVKDQLKNTNTSKTPPAWLNSHLRSVVAVPLTTQLDGLASTINNLDAKIPTRPPTPPPPVQQKVPPTGGETGGTTETTESPPGLQHTQPMPPPVNTNENSYTGTASHQFGHLNMATVNQQDLQALLDRQDRERKLERQNRLEEARDAARAADLKDALRQQQIAHLRQELGYYNVYSNRPRM